MRKTLEDLYYGNITPNAQDMAPNSELKRVWAVLLRIAGVYSISRLFFQPPLEVLPSPANFIVQPALGDFDVLIGFLRHHNYVAIAAVVIAEPTPSTSTAHSPTRRRSPSRRPAPRKKASRPPWRSSRKSTPMGRCSPHPTVPPAAGHIARTPYRRIVRKSRTIEKRGVEKQRRKRSTLHSARLEWQALASCHPQAGRPPRRGHDHGLVTLETFGGLPQIFRRNYINKMHPTR
mgnify:CR=1 FL=1